MQSTPAPVFYIFSSIVFLRKRNRRFRLYLPVRSVSAHLPFETITQNVLDTRAHTSKHDFHIPMHFESVFYSILQLRRYNTVRCTADRQIREGA